MKKEYQNIFNEFKLLEEWPSKIIGGQDPGYDTNTSQCTNWYGPGVGPLPDTDHDGDWVDACN